jgi:hypothetical protein
VTVVTVVLGTRMLDDVSAARELLRTIKASRPEQEAWTSVALSVVNRGVAAYRVSAADPYVPDLSPLDARAVRIGYGEAGYVVRGGWDEAFGVPPPPPPRIRRTVRLMPMQGMSAVLRGSARMLEAEELILRVVRDLDQGRNRAAAVTLNVAQELLLAELAGDVLAAPVHARIEKLVAARDAFAELAQRAVHGRLTEDDVMRLRELAEDAGAVVDSWRYAPLGY